MGNINELKLEEIDYEIKRLSKELPIWELMAGIWNIRELLDGEKGELIPDGVDENDLQVTVTKTLLDRDKDQWLYLYRELQEKEKELKNMGLALLGPGDVKYQHKRISDELTRLHTLRRKKLELEDTPASTPQDTAKVQGVTTFPLPPGAKASDIEIIFLDGKVCRITINGNQKTFDYAQIGFSHKQTGQHTALWNAMLEYAEGGGGASRNNKNIQQKRGERINEILQKFFVTDKDLIRANQPLFDIRKKRRQDQRPTNIQSKKCPYCNKQHKYYCNTCNDETEHCKECHNGLYEETHKEFYGRLHNLDR